MTYLVLLIAVLIFSAGASVVYLRLGRKYGPYAKPNFRSLHERATLRGGGIAIAVSALAGCLYLYAKGDLSFAQLMVYVLGGTIVAAVGVLDDRWDIPARYRLPFQVLAAGWVCFWLKGLPSLDLGFATVSLGWLGHVGLLVACVWFFNLYNFIDGIDGMASSAAIFICSAMGIILWLAQQHVLAAILGLLAVSNAGFLVFNWTPAKMFMGEAGSSFISYVLAAVLVQSLWTDASLLWAWLMVCAYYICDTSLTNLVRALTLPKWYQPHRSHAYQNLARVWNDHRKVVWLVLAIDAIWLIPLLFVMLHNKSYAVIIVAVAYAPLVLFNLRYGPRFENK
jgi:Fuc2NAc and GlcNAc transferase